MSPTTPRSAAGSGPLTRLTGAWQAASPRERKLLLAAAAVVGVALVVSALDWSREQRTRLGRSLPRAEAQLEQVQESATEITRLRAQPVPRRPAGPALLETVQASAKSRGLGLTIQASGDGLQVKGQGGFDELVTWLATLQTDIGLRVMRMEIQGQGAAASIDVVLVAGTSEG
ncbi:type II secretion system protein GspM [Zoogloea sp.]|uniref:type II secretion system protein GspM n=1 Tax=Zoogloea sp. TaxID=49181 RepID=UPI0026164802|nr:type II secretion system protein GspM [Zoogloea sp.]